MDPWVAGSGFSWERAFDRAAEDLWVRIGQRVSGDVEDVFGFPHARQPMIGRLRNVFQRF